MLVACAEGVGDDQRGSRGQGGDAVQFNRPIRAMVQARLNVGPGRCAAPHGGRTELPDPGRLTAATLRLAADEDVIAATFRDQPLEVEHRPALARTTVRGQRLMVLTQSTEGVQLDHGARFAVLRICTWSRLGGCLDSIILFLPDELHRNSAH